MKLLDSLIEERSQISEAQVLSTRAYDPDDEELVPRLARWRHLLTNP